MYEYHEFASDLFEESVEETALLQYFVDRRNTKFKKTKHKIKDNKKMFLHGLIKPIDPSVFRTENDQIIVHQQIGKISEFERKPVLIQVRRNREKPYYSLDNEYPSLVKTVIAYKKKIHSSSADVYVDYYNRKTQYPVVGNDIVEIQPKPHLNFLERVETISEKFVYNFAASSRKHFFYGKPVKKWFCEGVHLFGKDRDRSFQNFKPKYEKRFQDAMLKDGIEEYEDHYYDNDGWDEEWTFDYEDNGCYVPAFKEPENWWEEPQDGLKQNKYVDDTYDYDYDYGYSYDFWNEDIEQDNISQDEYEYDFDYDYDDWE